MALIGFSTGALARGDFRRALRLQSRSHANAVELSALRESEVDPLINALDELDLSGLAYKSFHAPSKLEKMSETYLVSRLREVARREMPIVVHPDVIKTPSLWKSLGRWLLIENMDQRKSYGRTVSELEHVFEQLPEARFCFDIGHARQVDPTMSTSVELLLAFANRLAEIHLSEVGSDSRHVAISSTTANAYRRVSSIIPKDIPVILESMVPEDGIEEELEMALQCFEPNGQNAGGRRLASGVQ